jgi:hypothetical protein
MGSISSYSLNCQMNNLARSLEKMNWRNGFPVPEMMKGVPFSVVPPSVWLRKREGEGEGTLGEKTLVNESWDNVRVFQVVVVVRSKDVGRDSGSEVAAKLLVVRAAHAVSCQTSDEEGGTDWL